MPAQDTEKKYCRKQQEEGIVADADRVHHNRGPENIESQRDCNGTLTEFHSGAKEFRALFEAEESYDCGEARKCETQTLQGRQCCSNTVESEEMC
jgi:hypothetical protein